MIIRRERNHDESGLKNFDIEAIVTIESIIENGFTAFIEPQTNVLKFLKDEDLKIVFNLLEKIELKQGMKIKIKLNYERED